MLQDVICRFGVVKLEIENEESMLDLMALSLTLNLAMNGINDSPSFLVNDADKHQANDAYVQRLNSSTPLLNISLALFDWGVSSLDFNRPGARLAFFKATHVRLWTALDTVKGNWPLTSESIAGVGKYFDRLVSHSG